MYERRRLASIIAARDIDSCDFEFAKESEDAPVSLCPKADEYKKEN
jgi:hypothetical protein